MTRKDARQQVFRRMVTREAGAGAGAAAIAAASRRLCEHLAEQLTPLIGVGGVAAICDRSLHLAQQKFPELAPLDTTDRTDPPFAHLQRFLERQEPAATTEAAVAVLVTAADLLALFIGESLTIRILREVWPDDFTGTIAEEIAT